jgi:hypothetical protein
MRGLLALIGLLFAAPALADTIAVYSANGGMMTMVVEIAANGDMRVSMGGTMFEEMKRKAPAGMDVDQLGGIVRGGENYMIQPGPGRKPVVIRMADAAAVMKEYLDAHRGDMPTPPDDMAGPKLIERGTAKINGRTGKAFYIEEGEGMPLAVVSADPDLAELAGAMRRQFGTSTEMMVSVGLPAMGKSMDAVLAQGAPIAFAGMELQSVKHDPIPAARFVLPADPATRDQVRALMTRTAESEAKPAAPQP